MKAGRIAIGLTIIAACLIQGIATSDEVNAGGVVSSRELFFETTAGSGEVLASSIIMPTEAEINQIIEQNNSWKNPGALVMADVNAYVNVRTEPDADSERIGVLYKNCGGTIVEYGEEWTKLESGDVVGWVNNEYLLFADEAQQLAEEVGCMRATVNTTTLRVRSEANTDSEILGVVGQGEVFEVVSEEDGWVAIDYSGKDGYICSEYLDIEFHVDHGETIAAIRQREEEEAAARAAREAEAARREATRYQYYGQYGASASDVILLGALINCEAGNQPYEGKVAVGAVVMNRVRSAAYPNTLYGVIYASGQFTPAMSGAVDRRIAENSISDECLQAAQEALNGYSNVGSAMYFRRVGYHDGIVIGAHVFW